MHRTVSALLTARAFHAGVAVMLVHSFSPASRWREDFDAFAAALGATPLTADVHEIKLAGSPRLLIGWCKGAEEYLSVELPSGI